jgi:copper(I)-binding protein
MGLDEALTDGGALPLTLVFAKSGPKDVVVPVRATAPSGADDPHADH